MTAQAYPDTVKVEQINSRHQEHREYSQAWEDYEILHCGGHRIRQVAARFLQRRAKEPDDVFASRTRQFNYTNLLGTIIGWYLAKMFRQDPEIDISLTDASGQPTETKLSGDDQRFVDTWLGDCDRAGTTYIDFFRDAFRDMLLYRNACILLDLPASDPSQFRNKREQINSGALTPYVSLWNPRNVINWSHDRHGMLEWAVLYSSTEERTVLGPSMTVERWTIIDRNNIAVYVRQYRADDTNVPSVARLEMPARPHVLSDLNRVPLYRIGIPEALHIADRISLNARCHLNTENALDWALAQNNLAVPVITGKFDQKLLTLSEVGAIALPEGGEIHYLEHSGNSFVISASRLEQIREEIYRAAYLMDQGRSSAGTPASQSGISKQADKEPANDVLNAFGDRLRAAMQHLLDDVLHVRELQGMKSDVRGYSFDGSDPLIEVELLGEVRALNIPSDSLDKELMKRIARASLTDANRTLLAKVASEIDASASREDRETDSMVREQETVQATSQKFAA